MSKVDRGPLDSKNLVGIMMDLKNDLYKLGRISKEILKTWFSRNDIKNSLTAFQDEVPDNVITIRDAVAHHSRIANSAVQRNVLVLHPKYHRSSTMLLCFLIAGVIYYLFISCLCYTLRLSDRAEGGLLIHLNFAFVLFL